MKLTGEYAEAYNFTFFFSRKKTSSLGAMTVPYLQELYLSFCGINTFTPEGSNIQKGYKKNGGTPPATIVYPSTFTIDNSNVGREVISLSGHIVCSFILTDL